MRIRNLKKKLTCFAASAVLCLTSTNLGAFADDTVEKVTLPGSFREAVDWYNTYYGGTRITEDGYIYIIRKEEEGGFWYATRTPENSTDELLCHKIYTDKDEASKLYFMIEISVYKPKKSTKSEFALVEGGFNDEESVLYTYTFETDAKGNVKETDVYGWAPDCNNEFRLYKMDNPKMVLRDNCLAYWDEVCSDGGYTISVEQEGDGKFDMMDFYNFYQKSNVDGEILIPGDGYRKHFYIYKPSNPGDVTITFTNGQQPPRFNKVSEDAVITTKKYNISKDLKATEIGNINSDLPDWIPTTHDEYEKYIKSNPKVVLRDNLVVYWGSEAGSFCNVDTVLGDGEFEMKKISCSRPLKEGAVGGSDDYVKVYKPKKAGTVVMSWTYGANGMSKTNDFIIVDNSVDRSYKIDKDMNVTETFDWVPKDIAEYENYLKRHEPIAANGDYIVYSAIRWDRGWLGESYDEEKLKKLSEKDFSLKDADDSPVCDIAVYGKTDKIKSGDTVDMSWWNNLSIWTKDNGADKVDVEKHYVKSKSFIWNGTGFEAVKLKGDINNRGYVDKDTLKEFGRYLTKNGTIDSFENSDMNSDGKLNVKDYLILKRQIVKENKYPITLDNNTVELTADIKPFSVQSAKPTDDFENSQIDFALSLLRKTVDSSENVLVSPYSVAQALAMTANGADKNTLKEMMKVIGNGMDIGTFNKQMASYRIGQPNEEKCKLLTANSIWCTNDTERFTADKNFLLNNKSYYDAQIFSTPFNDSSVTAVNDWVSKHTDGMIPSIIDRFDGDEIMALVNAVTFDAKWKEPYKKAQDSKEFFNAANGKKQDAKLLVETNLMPYFEDKEATGFMKYYEGGRYAFAAILPNEGTSVDEYVSGLSTEKLTSLFKSANKELTLSVMPKFGADYKKSLVDELKAMGIKDAFSTGAADFTKMGKSLYGGVHISDVIHKTHIEVDEEGTRAAAATIVTMKDGAAMTDMKEVILDRPFVYAIVDTQTNIPIFIGTLLTLE